MKNNIHIYIYIYIYIYIHNLYIHIYNYVCIIILLSIHLGFEDALTNEDIIILGYIVFLAYIE